MERINLCIADLFENGIPLELAPDRTLRALVRRHVDYFQLMLGYDSDAEEIVALVKSRRGDEAPESEKKED